MTRDIWLISALSLGLLGGLVLVSDGFFIVDEVIYFLGAHAFAANGSFFIDNGFHQFGSNDLRLWLLRGRPEGLTPQYPPGTAILGGWFLGLVGMKGMMALNTLAAVATLFVTYALSRRLFEDAPAILAVLLLALCTFWIEYAYAYWPHTISILLITLALFLFLPALDADDGAWRPALAAGLVTGVSLLIRLDGLLILPGFVLASILFARRPVPVLLAGLAGLLPGLLLLAMLNAEKFGVFNPLSYGHTNNGGTNLVGYAAPISVLAIGFGAVVWIRVRGMPRPPVLVIAVLAIAVLAVLVPPVGNLLMKLLRGVDHILLDIHGIPDNREGVVRNPNGTTLFWGLPKKALAQSLPWIGLLAALIWMPRRRNVVLVLMVFGLWCLPFLLRSWHGGLGSNMRYLLPVIPALCVLTGWVLHQLLLHAPQRGVLVVAGAIAGLVAATLWTLFIPSGLAGTHQIMPLIVLAVLVIAALASRWVVWPVLLMVGLGFGVSSYLAASDLMNAQKRRGALAAEADKIRQLPAKTVVYSIPEVTWPVAVTPGRMAAIFDVRSGEIDAEFVSEALQDHRVLVLAGWAQRFVTMGFSLASAPEFADMGLLEVRP